MLATAVANEQSPAEGARVVDGGCGDVVVDEPLKDVGCQWSDPPICVSFAHILKLIIFHCHDLP